MWFWLCLCRFKSLWILLHLFCCRFTAFPTCLVEVWWSTRPWSIVERSRFFRCLYRCALVLDRKPWLSSVMRVQVSIQKVSFSQQCKNSCRTSYGSTQTGNESTQTESFPWLSRPRSWPVWTRSNLVQEKKGEWVDARSKWVDTLKFPRIESTCGSTCSDPRVLRRVMSRLTELKPPKMSFCNVIHIFCTLFFACNGYFRDKNERNWPIEWKWVDLIHEHDQKTLAPRGQNGWTEHKRLSGTHIEWKITWA